MREKAIAQGVPSGTEGRREAGPWLHVILHEPEIPPNTGNVIRLCANTGAWLHLVGPLGFKLDDKRLKRAGLDYHDMARVFRHDGLAEALAAAGAAVGGAGDGDRDGDGAAGLARAFAFTTHGRTGLPAVRFARGDALVFGAESRGLPAMVRERFPPAHRVRLPMRPGSRSLNLANACAVAVFEAWRQLGYPGAADADGEATER